MSIVGCYAIGPANIQYLSGFLLIINMTHYEVPGRDVVVCFPILKIDYVTWKLT